MKKTDKRMLSLVVAVMYALCILVAAPVQAFASTPGTHQVNTIYTAAQKAALIALENLPSNTKVAKSYDNYYEYTVLKTKYTKAYNAISKVRNMGMNVKLFKNYNRLAVAKGRLNELTSILKKLEGLPAWIASLPATANMTLNDYLNVEGCHEMYDRLRRVMTRIEMKMLYNENKLIDSIDYMWYLNTPRIYPLLEMIEWLKTAPRPYDRNGLWAMEASRISYDELSDKEKTYIYNYKILTDAEDYLYSLKSPGAHVVDYIGALSVPVTIYEIDAMQKARIAYTKLSASEKLIVTNLDVLVRAEAEMKILLIGQ